MVEIYDTDLKMLMKLGKNVKVSEEELHLMEAKIINRIQRLLLEARQYLGLLGKAGDIDKDSQIWEKTVYWKTAIWVLDDDIAEWCRERKLEPDKAFPDVRPVPVKWNGDTFKEGEVLDFGVWKTADGLKLITADKFEKEILGYCKYCTSEIKRGAGGIPFCGCGRLEGFIEKTQTKEKKED